MRARSRRLVSKGITVVVAAGNDGERRLVPPGTAPMAITALDAGKAVKLALAHAHGP